MAGVFGGAASAAFARAAKRAKLVIRPGDRVRVSSCGGHATVTFAAWTDYRGLPDPNGRSFSSRSLDDLSPWNVTKVNGMPVNFRDQEGERAVALDNERFERERAHRHAANVQHRRSSIHALSDTRHGE